ncbi:MAG TPA: hypothetical protein VFB80_19395, partial [Pirellulaceae bacterium]|nr:hypothetical protein [Pirellulaceae bacterium]
MSSPDDPPKRGWRSIRFTLGELFLLLAGLALGLAYARVDGSDRWHDFLLAIFGGCFVVGLVQKSWRTWSLRRGDSTISFIDAIWPLAVAVLMVFTGVMQAAARHNWWAFQDFNGDTFWGTGDLTDTAFYLAVICGYFQLRETVPAQGWRRWMALLLNATALLLGAYWLLVLLEEGMLLIALVHTAIQGVELAMPTRWAGKPFYPANLHTELTRQFVARAYWTAALLAGAVVANIALARTWSRGWSQRVLWSVVCTLLLIVAWRLDWWCVRVGFPTLSPFIYSVVDTL